MMKRLLCLSLFVVLLPQGFAVGQNVNYDIIDQAKTYVDQSGWTCKQFINQVIGDIGGRIGGAVDLGYRECYLRYGFMEVDTPEYSDWHSPQIQGTVST